MRAMYNPTRMKAIEKATRNLITKINRACPKCSCPGFDLVERRAGLPCLVCHWPTALIHTEIYRCQKCQFEREVLFPDRREFADPSQCEYCNP
jgi:hypothetical protein